jgi:hypothetical protein
MNFSEKRPGDELTGKFGLGFKSVHVLSDSVGIASGFIGMRTRGGILPVNWPEGIEVGERQRHPDGRKATVIDIPFTDATAEEGNQAVSAFKSTMTWLPAIASTIRRVEVVGETQESVDCSHSPLLNRHDIYVVSISGRFRERALRLDLSNGFFMLLRLNDAGPCRFGDDLRRLWNLAPLEEDLRSGWLLNGPFAIDPGRTGLAGSVPDAQQKFQELGRVLGDRLVRLHDLAEAEWREFAASLDLDPSTATAWDSFWSQVFDVFEPDLDDPLARHLHANDRGYGELAGRCQVVPTGLLAPFAPLVRASDVKYFTEGALAEATTLVNVRAWPALMEFRELIVASKINGQLRKLGFQNGRPLRFSKLLNRQLGQDKKVRHELAQTLGFALNLDSIQKSPLNGELDEILEIARQALFLAQDGTWRESKLLSPDAGASPEERRLCAFAPAKQLLDTGYTGTALEFFRVARMQSGFGPQARDFGSWLAEVNDDDADRQVAALRYVIEGRQGRELGEKIRSIRPSWLPSSAASIRNSLLLSGWSEKDKDDLLYFLQGRDAFLQPSSTLPPSAPLSPILPSPAQPETVLAAIHSWWSNEASSLKSRYSDRTYPSFFSPLQLLEGEDRTAWFTMFALACFQSFGRTQDGQHRSFVEVGYREGWWHDLAKSRPPGDVQSWIERLERWTAPDQFDQQYMIWRRTFVDLYSVARWLDEYREIVAKLPRIIEEQGVIALRDALQPSYWPPASRLSIDAAPMNRSLGIGLNWMIREMLRYGVYEARDEDHIVPYSWAPSQRVRDLLNGLGADLDHRADKDTSRTIYDFVTRHLGREGGRFDGDFDLPLQLITREENRTVRDQCFEAAGCYPPNFDEELSQDEFEDEAIKE